MTTKVPNRGSILNSTATNGRSTRSWTRFGRRTSILVKSAFYLCASALTSGAGFESSHLRAETEKQITAYGAVVRLRSTIKQKLSIDICEGVPLNGKIEFRVTDTTATNMTSSYQIKSELYKMDTCAS